MQGHGQPPPPPPSPLFAGTAARRRRVAATIIVKEVKREKETIPERWKKIGFRNNEDAFCSRSKD